jgi:hypothetical protein
MASPPTDALQSKARSGLCSDGLSPHACRRTSSLSSSRKLNGKKRRSSVNHACRIRGQCSVRPKRSSLLVYTKEALWYPPPFFEAVGRDSLCFWGDDVGPTVFALADWSDETLPALQTRLAEAQDWLILTPPVKSSSNRGSLLQRVGIDTRFCISSGNATHVRGWWKSGCDQCSKSARL